MKFKNIGNEVIKWIIKKLGFWFINNFLSEKNDKLKITVDKMLKNYQTKISELEKEKTLINSTYFSPEEKFVYLEKNSLKRNLLHKAAMKYG